MELLKKCNTLPPSGKFSFSLQSFIMDNMPKFHTNSDMHTVNTKHKHDLHVPNANLNRYEKVV